MTAVTATPKARASMLSVNPRYSIYDCPDPDIVLVPADAGTRTIVYTEAVLDWIKKVNGMTDLTLSVCTGALVLARRGGSTG
jgi:putative intracellular protease/amidase